MIGQFLAVLVVIAVLIWLVSWRTGSDTVRGAGVGSSIVLLTLAPLGQAPPSATAATLAALAFLGISVSARTQTPFWRVQRGIPITGLFLYQSIVQAFNRHAPIQTITFTLVAIVITSMARDMLHRDFVVMMRILIFAGLGHTMVALSEQFGLLGTIWKDSSAGTDISLRANELVPSMVGRSVSTFGHPIPLSVFGGFLGMSVLYLTIRRQLSRSLGLLGGTESVLLLVCGGSRSVVFAVGVCLLITLVVHVKAVWLRIILTLGGAMIFVLNIRAIFASLGLSGSEFAGSASYIHRSEILRSTIEYAHSVDVGRALFGSGFSVEQVFQNQIIQGFPGLWYFDDQYAALFVLYGAIGLLLFLIVLGVCFRKGFASAPPIGLYFLILALSFDFLTHSSVIAILILAVVQPNWHGNQSQSGVSLTPERNAETIGFADSQSRP